MLLHDADKCVPRADNICLLDCRLRGFRCGYLYRLFFYLYFLFQSWDVKNLPRLELV